MDAIFPIIVVGVITYITLWLSIEQIDPLLLSAIAFAIALLLVGSVRWVMLSQGVYGGPISLPLEQQVIQTAQGHLANDNLILQMRLDDCNRNKDMIEYQKNMLQYDADMAKYNNQMKVGPEFNLDPIYKNNALRPRNSQHAKQFDNDDVYEYMKDAAIKGGDVALQAGKVIGNAGLAAGKVAGNVALGGAKVAKDAAMKVMGVKKVRKPRKGAAKDGRGGANQFDVNSKGQKVKQDGTPIGKIGRPKKDRGAQPKKPRGRPKKNP